MTTAPEPEPSDADLQAAAWNADNPIGTPIMYWPRFDGPGRITRTRSVAMAPHVAAALMGDR